MAEKYTWPRSIWPNLCKTPCSKMVRYEIDIIMIRQKYPGDGEFHRANRPPIPSSRPSSTFCALFELSPCLFTPLAWFCALTGSFVHYIMNLGQNFRFKPILPASHRRPTPPPITTKRARPVVACERCRHKKSKVTLSNCCSVMVGKC